VCEHEPEVRLARANTLHLGDPVLLKTVREIGAPEQQGIVEARAEHTALMVLVEPSWSLGTEQTPTRATK
jgi:hypothetical protein